MYYSGIICSEVVCQLFISENLCSPYCKMYINEQEADTLYFLSVAYKETDVPKICANHEHLCSMRRIHFRDKCFLFDIREIYNIEKFEFHLILMKSIDNS